MIITAARNLAEIRDLAFFLQIHAVNDEMKNEAKDLSHQSALLAEDLDGTIGRMMKQEEWTNDHMKLINERASDLKAKLNIMYINYKRIQNDSDNP